MLSIGSLFSGIGGLELGLERAGLGTVAWQVERDPYCQRVLAKHWPKVERFDDVREVGAHNLGSVDIVCGGFPCQDISSAGKGAGLAGSRSGLWREFDRIVGECSPRWIVVENVASGASRWVDAVVRDLELAGYETLPIPLSARDVGAPFDRGRVFVVARANGDGESAGTINAQVAPLPQTSADPGHWGQHPGVVSGVDDGLPHRLDRLRALGNAVVPQCAEVVGWVIRELMDGER